MHFHTVTWTFPIGEIIGMYRVYRATDGLQSRLMRPQPAPLVVLDLNTLWQATRRVHRIGQTTAQKVWVLSQGQF